MRLGRNAVLGGVVAFLCACVDAESRPEPSSQEVLVLEVLAPPIIRRLGVGQPSQDVAFAAPTQGYLHDAVYGGALGSVVLSYTVPPVTADDVAFDRSAIVELTPTGETRTLACGDAADVWCTNIVSTEDVVIYVETGARVATDGPVIMAYDRQTDVSETLVRHATEPALSPSGDQLVWIGVEPTAGARSLVLGELDGTLTATLVLPDTFYDIGVPFFSADGSSVFVLVLEEPTVAWYSRAIALAIPTAVAHANHDLPGDWWEIPLDGGPAVQVTWLSTLQYEGRSDPDGEWLFAATREGVVKASTDGQYDELIVEGRAFRSLDVMAP